MNRWIEIVCHSVERTEESSCPHFFHNLKNTLCLPQKSDRQNFPYVYFYYIAYPALYLGLRPLTAVAERTQNCVLLIESEQKRLCVSWLCHTAKGRCPLYPYKELSSLTSRPLRAPYHEWKNGGEGLQICAERGSFADATLLVVNEQGEYRRGVKIRPYPSFFIYRRRASLSP